MERRGLSRYSLSGTPADCVRIGPAPTGPRCRLRPVWNQSGRESGVGCLLFRHGGGRPGRRAAGGAGNCRFPVLQEGPSHRLDPDHPMGATPPGRAAPGSLVRRDLLEYQSSPPGARSGRPPDRALPTGRVPTSGDLSRGSGGLPVRRRLPPEAVPPGNPTSTPVSRGISLSPKFG